MILLPPGVIVSSTSAVTALLWRTGLSIQSMAYLQVVLAVAVNAAIWSGLMAIYSKLRERGES
jgi:hypothetical protein